MMNKTLIEWVKNPDGTLGYTWNPLTGCLNHIKGLCKGGNFPCYAYRLAQGRLKERYLANTVMPLGNLKVSDLADPFYPRFWPERVYDNWGFLQHLGNKPRGIFVCDMSDLFGIGIPEDWTRHILDFTRMNPNHRFYLLTKQPQNLLKFSPFPDNCWVGVTITNNYTYLGDLAKVETKIKYLSIEPLLAWDNLPAQRERFVEILTEKLGINWLIIGAQTKPTIYPKIEWLGEIVEAADKVGVKVFLKDNLRPLLIDDKGYAHAGAELLDRVIETGTWRLRQEMPSG